jgi:hypothetical protein
MNLLLSLAHHCCVVLCRNLVGLGGRRGSTRSFEMGERGVVEGGKAGDDEDILVVDWGQIRGGFPTSFSGRQSYVQHIPCGGVTLSSRWGQFRG